MSTTSLYALLFDRISVNRTLMVSFEEVIRYDQVSDRFNLLARKFKEFLEQLYHADIPLACEVVPTITDKPVCRKEGKSSIAQQLKTSTFRRCNNLVL